MFPRRKTLQVTACCCRRGPSITSDRDWRTSDRFLTESSPASAHYMSTHAMIEGTSTPKLSCKHTHTHSHHTRTRSPYDLLDAPGQFPVKLSPQSKRGELGHWGQVMPVFGFVVVTPIPTKSPSATTADCGGT